MTIRKFVLVSGAMLALASFGVRAQDDEPTIRAIPDPTADLPDAVTKDIPLPETAASQASNSDAGRSGERRDAGLAKARDAAANGLDHASGADDSDVPGDTPAADQDGLATAGGVAADAAADGLATAADAAARGADFGQDIAAAAEANREDFGRNHEPDALPDQTPADVPPAPDQVPVDLPTPPAGGG